MTFRSFSLTALAIAALVAASCNGYVPTGYPAPNTGSTTLDIGPASYSIIDQGDDVGAFRTNCRRSHFAYADPIVYPGQDNKGHLHMFFGNSAAGRVLTMTDPTTASSSTCAGGIANRTAYWVPAMLDISTPSPTVIDSTLPDGGPDPIQGYYKSGYSGVLAGTVQPFPAGLKMIAGVVPFGPAPMDLQHTWWSCQPTDTIDGSFSLRRSTIPADCPAGHLVMASVRFPQCWDGVNLDSPDHRSHMAYPLGWPDLGCPSSHPVPLMEIEEHIRWTSDGNTGSWRLASDYMQMSDTESMTAAPGSTLHADWWNGWDADVMDRIVDQCINPGLDCQMNLIGDDEMLTSPGAP